MDIFLVVYREDDRTYGQAMGVHGRLYLAEEHRRKLVSEQSDDDPRWVEIIEIPTNLHDQLRLYL